MHIRGAGPLTLLKPLDGGSGGQSEENVSELEMNMLLAFKEQESRYRLPLPAPHVIIVTLLSHRTLKLTRKLIKAELIIAD